VKACVPAGEQRIGVVSDRVGDDRFLEQADGEDGQADQQVARNQPAELPGLQLRHHLLEVDDRPGDQLREEGGEERKIEQADRLGLAPCRVDQIGQLLEGEERDRQRQGYMGQPQFPAEGPVEVVDDEVGVLEPTQHRQVDQDPEHQQAAHQAGPFPGLGALDEDAQGEVEADGEQQQGKLLDAPIGVETEGQQRQGDLGRRLAPATEAIGDGQRHRQEAEYEQQGVEEQRVLPSVE